MWNFILIFFNHNKIKNRTSQWDHKFGNDEWVGRSPVHRAQFAKVAAAFLDLFQLRCWSMAAGHPHFPLLFDVVVLCQFHRQMAVGFFASSMLTIFLWLSWLYNVLLFMNSFLLFGWLEVGWSIRRYNLGGTNFD